MTITTEQVKELRDKTGVSVMECKKALEQAQGDMDKALAILGLRSADIMRKKADRALGAGVVSSYIHNTAQVGAMIVLSCETDFVAKNEEFVTLARDIAMHAAAMRPENVESMLTQSFIKDQDKTITDLISGAVQKFGERIEVSSLSVASIG